MNPAGSRLVRESAVTAGCRAARPRSAKRQALAKMRVNCRDIGRARGPPLPAGDARGPSDREGERAERTAPIDAPGPATVHTRPVTPEKRATRLLYGALIAVTAAFILASIAQVARDLYSDDHPKVTGACAAAVERLVEAVDAGDAAEAGKVWSGYPGNAAACDADPVGADALAAVERYRRSALRPAGEARDLGRVRRAAMSFIR